MLNDTAFTINDDLRPLEKAPFPNTRLTADALASLRLVGLIKPTPAPVGGESTPFHGLIIPSSSWRTSLNKRRRPRERLPRPYWLGALRWIWGQKVHLDTASAAAERASKLFNFPLKRILSLHELSQSLGMLLIFCFEITNKNSLTFNLRQDTAPFLGFVGQLQRKRNLLFLKSGVNTALVLLKNPQGS